LNYPQDFVDKLHNEDCITLMQSMPDDVIDLVVTSPPYFVGKEYEKKVGWAEYESLMDRFYIQCRRLLKPGGYLVINFGDFHNSKGRFYDCEVTSTQPASPYHFEWGRKQDFDLQATRVWVKQHARCALGFICNKRPRPAFDFEHIWTWRKRGNDGAEWVNKRALSQRGTLGADWKSSARLDIHCAAFPLELPLWGIKVYTKDSERTDSIVFDPFMGSGTTIIAAIQEGCHFIGCEKNQEYLDVAKERILKDTDVIL
jgi:DNA modification methylase